MRNFSRFLNPPPPVPGFPESARPSSREAVLGLARTENRRGLHRFVEAMLAEYEQTEGPDDESRAILERLFDAMESPDVRWEHEWSVGDTLMWENRGGLMHTGRMDYPRNEARLFIRTTVRGVPTRAWEFASLSNERDRPALAMPRAQSIIDVLLTFGWRDSRQDPITLPMGRSFDRAAICTPIRMEFPFGMGWVRFNVPENSTFDMSMLWGSSGICETLLAIIFPKGLQL